MRVSIEHREAAWGVLDNEPRYYIDLEVNFSEEELAIIKARGLYERTIDVEPGVVGEIPIQHSSPYLVPFLRAGSPILLVLGVILAVMGIEIGHLLILIAPPMWVCGWWLDRQGQKLPEEPPTTISLRQLIDQSPIVIRVADPAAAQHVEQVIHEALVAAKRFIFATATLGTRKAFRV